MVKYAWIFLIVLFMMLFSGCAHKSENVEATEKSADIYSDTDMSEVFSESKKSESVYETYSDNEYTGDVEMAFAEDEFVLKKLDIPADINGEQMTVLCVLDKKTLLCSLKPVQSDNMHEIGTWDMEGLSYSKLADVSEGVWRVVAYNDEYIFLEYYAGFDMYSMSMGTVSQLWLYERSTKNMEQIYQYSVNNDGEIGPVSYNHRVLYDGCLYFEDLIQNESGQWIGQAYSYSIADKKLRFIGDNMQNPQLKDGEIWYIQINPEGTGHWLKSISSDSVISMPEYVLGMSSDGQDIFVVYEDHVGENTGVAVAGLKRLGQNRDLFRTLIYMTELQSNEYLTTWVPSPDGDYPLFYCNKENRLLRLKDMDKGMHSYWLKENYGLILSYFYSEDGSAGYQYTFFEYNADNMTDISVDFE